MGSDDDRSDSGSRRKSRKMSDGDDKSRSKSRSRSRSRGGGGNNNGRLTKVIDIAKDDAAFVLGRGGATTRSVSSIRS